MDKTFAILLLLFCQSFLYGQEKDDNFGGITMVNFSYGFGLSGGDLADRFGSKNIVGTGVAYQSKNNIIAGINFDYFFGTKVKEDVISSLRDETGRILGVNGEVASVLLRERGLNLNLSVGKVFLLNENSRSGLRLQFGFGMMQHWVRVQDDTRSVPQLAGEYRFGYDKKVRGISTTQFIGYQILSTNQRINFYAGFELYQGFTKNIRPFNFNSMEVESASRFDLINGIKVGFILPFYKVDNPDEIFY